LKLLFDFCEYKMIEDVIPKIGKSEETTHNMIWIIWKSLIESLEEVELSKF
jgi:hypothetical protein